MSHSQESENRFKKLRLAGMLTVVGIAAWFVSREQDPDGISVPGKDHLDAAVETNTEKPILAEALPVADGRDIDSSIEIAVEGYPGRLLLQIDEVRIMSPRTTVWTGHLEGEPGSLIAISQVDDCLDMYLLSTVTGEWTGQATTDSTVMSLQKLNLEEGFCHPLDDPSPAGAYGPDGPLVEIAEASELSSGGNPQVDILILYTANAAQALGSTSALEAKAETAVAAFNNLASRSGAGVSFNLVGLAKVSDYPTSGENNAFDGEVPEGLQRMNNRNDGWIDNIDLLRESFGADLVSLFIAEDLGNDGGPVYGYASVKGPFSCLNASTANGVGPHEWGHNMGCGHNGSDAPPGSRSGTSLKGTFAYSKAHFFEYGGETRSTFMSYIGKRFAHFSNPLVNWNNLPTGTANRDHARTISENAPEISAWQLPVPPDGADTDGDGYSDRMERLLKTDPNDSSSLLEIATSHLLPDQQSIWISGRMGIRYCLYRSYDLSSGQWELVDCQGPLSRDLPVLFPKEGTDLNQPSVYYRLEVSLGE